MIRITKPPGAPAKLAEGVALVRAQEIARLADPTEGASSKKAFKFNKKIYGAAAVKRLLRTSQHDKCCYCEGSFAGHASGDVEHFRPKTCFQQTKGGPIDYPGYYWLTYDWSNLFYACEICNRVGKRNLFPISNPENRRRSGSDGGVENPEILDPGGAQDPRDHIVFYGAVPQGVTPLGRTTIDALGLRRTDLTVARLQHLKLLDALRDLANLPTANLGVSLLAKREKAAEDLEAMVRPDAIYSAMAQDFIAG